MEWLYPILPTLTTGVFFWLWRKAKVERSLAETRMVAAEKELAVAQKTAADLRTVLADRHRELKECREKLPPAALLDDFFGRVPSGDPGPNND
jgi:hypothetical protein